MHRQLSSLIKVDITDNQLAAIESFISDRGIEAFQNSKLLKVINANDFESVPAEFRKWTVANGKHSPELVALREKEIESFTKNNS